MKKNCHETFGHYCNCKHSWMTSEKNALMFYLACYDCHKNKSYSIDEIKILKFIEAYYIPNDKTLRYAESGGQHVIRPKSPSAALPGFVPPLFYQSDGFSRKVYEYNQETKKLYVKQSSQENSNLKGTVFEVLGDYHHSNPFYYKPEDISPRKGLPHKENYEYAMNRLKHIEEQGYKVYSTWITDFRRFTLDRKKEANIFDYMNIIKSSSKMQGDISLLYQGSKAKFKRKRKDSFTLIE